jgi:hypothetical protein
MKLFGRELEGYPRTLVVLAAVLLVASGLCGVQWHFSMGSQQGSAILIPLGVLELIAMLLSVAGIVIVLVLWAASALYARFAKPPKDNVQRLFDSPNKTKNNDPR